MAKYLFAQTNTEQLVHAQDLVGQKSDQEYTCIGCGNPLVAKVNGKIMQPHFAHKSLQECSGETYLHKLGKQVFFETYTQCLTNNIPFYIDITFSRKCRKYRNIIFKNCDLKPITQSYDLTKFYQDISIETKDGQFIPDLLLKSKTHPDKNIYIEIAVTHFLSESKQKSDNRIIEIPLYIEEDIDKIKKAHLTTADALFLGFDQPAQPMSDAECQCMHKQFLIFYVYPSGKAFLDSNTLSSINANFKKHNITYFNIVDTVDHAEFSYSQGDIFKQEVEKAATRKVNIKNCFLCKYQGTNYSFWNDEPIYCKAKKFTCSSNQAAQCDWYRPLITKHH